MRSRSKLPILILLALACPALARADIGLPLIFVEGPEMLMALVPVILIESAVYRKCLGIAYRKALWPAGVANVVSTLLGYPLAWGLRMFVQVVVSDPLAKLVGTSSTRTWAGYVFLALGPAWIGGEGDTWVLPVASLAGLIPTFFVSVYLEAWVLTWFFKDKGFAAIRTLSYKANLASYAFLVAGGLILLVVALRR
jgi:hypothetical protein